MLKIPTFIIGGLLILTGLVGYLFQDLGLSLKIKGPLADDAEFTLSDGNDSVVVDLGFPSSESAGEYAFWMVHQLNLRHAKDRSQGNYAVEKGSTAYETQSFWHASSKGDTQDLLVNHAETGAMGNLAKTDTNASGVRFVYKNYTSNNSPVTLTSTNWTNIDSNEELKPGDSLEFYKSWTAFIPGILGIILILLVQGAEKAPHAKKHIMHAAVLVGLVGFIAVAKMLPKAISEMNWLKGETYGIIHASSLKSTTMLASAGLLLVFVILCIVSFITARKDMATQAEAEAEKKKKVLNKVKAKNEDADDKNSKIEKSEKRKDLSKSSTKNVEKESFSSDNLEDSKSKSTKKPSDKKEDPAGSEKKKENNSSSKKTSTENQKSDTTSKSKEALETEQKKEPVKPQSDTTEPKKEGKPSAVLEKKQSKEPSKEVAPSKDSSSSSNSTSKDQGDSEKNKDEDKAEPKADAEKSDKEEKKE